MWAFIKRVFRKYIPIWAVKLSSALSKSFVRVPIIYIPAKYLYKFVQSLLSHHISIQEI